MAGRTTIKQFAAIAKKSALYEGSDSGAIHIAAAVGAPVVALFGASNTAEWGPQGKSDRSDLQRIGLPDMLPSTLPPRRAELHEVDFGR